jgi:hypothetical protein
MQCCIILYASDNSKQVWQIPDAACTDLRSWWWAEKPLETCRALTIIKSIIQRCSLLVMLKNGTFRPWTCIFVISSWAYQRVPETSNWQGLIRMSTAKCLLQYSNNIRLVLRFSRSTASQKTFVKTMESKNIVSCSRTKYITHKCLFYMSRLCSLFLLINVMLSVMLNKLCILHIQSICVLFLILTVCQLFL